MSVLATMIATALIVSGSQSTPVEPNAPAPIWLHGQFQQGPSTMVPYPAGFVPGLEGNMPLGESLPIGVRNTEALQNTPGPKVLMGTSQGAMVLDQVMADDTRAGVPASKVSFVVIEDPQRGSGILSFMNGVFIPGMNYTPKKPVETPYQVSVITREYEGVADMPNRVSPGYPLAVLNAIMGGYYHHQNAVFSDLSSVPKPNITTTVNKLGGKTTTYLVPTRTLPLLQPLVDLHVPAPIVSALNGFLKPIVDSAYGRKPQSPRRMGELTSRTGNEAKAQPHQKPRGKSK